MFPNLFPCVYLLQILKVKLFQTYSSKVESNQNATHSVRKFMMSNPFVTPRQFISYNDNLHMSRCMGTPSICIDKNKGADQPRSNCEADQRLCFRYTDSTIPLLSKCKTSTLSPSSATVKPSLCRTCLEPKLLVFSRTCSYYIRGNIYIFKSRNKSLQSQFPYDGTFEIRCS